MDQSPPDLKLIVDGLSCFTSKLPGKGCEKLVALLKSIKADKGLPPDQCQSLDPYLNALAVSTLHPICN